ncbi:MAG: ECF-type sigma factor [Chloracidobacterium sp.]|nr:ECF-type sigma factor [Chloracidobacterium sp.]MDW8216665.1 ECF-type sigma factor [Acidobacteriota bacterium]
MPDAGAVLASPPVAPTTGARVQPTVEHPATVNRFVEEVYAELRRLAHAHMRRERPGHTLQTTALVHETYLRLASCKNISLRDRRQFFSLASRMMRCILVDYARGVAAAKRGGRRTSGHSPRPEAGQHSGFGRHRS